MVVLANPWYAITLIGAPELWALFAALIFTIYIGMKIINRGRRDKKTKSRLNDLLILLVPTLVITFLVVMVLKGFFAVPRQCVPCIVELVGCNPYCPLDASFPSGHAATAFAGFNALWLFGIDRDEVKQSSFLAWLLNADASHGQGDVFLRAIIDACGLDIPLADTRRYRVETEFTGAESRIDVVVYRVGSFVIYLENKVDAPEQPDQVDREFRDMLARKGDRLLGPKIGRWGQLQEWMVDRDDPNEDHPPLDYILRVFVSCHDLFFLRFWTRQTSSSIDAE